MDKELNIINLLCTNIINRFDDLEEQGLIFHRQKQKGRQFIKELEKLSNVICETSSETDKEIYTKASNVFHKIELKLDNFLDNLYEPPNIKE